MKDGQADKKYNRTDAQQYKNQQYDFNSSQLNPILRLEVQIFYIHILILRIFFCLSYVVAKTKNSGVET